MSASIRRFRVDLTIWIKDGPVVQASDRPFLAQKAVLVNLDEKIKVEVSGLVLGGVGGAPAGRTRVFNIIGYPDKSRMPGWLTLLVNEAMEKKMI